MMTLSTVAKATNGQLIGTDETFNAVSTDSRKITTGNLFVALKGESFDGHDYAVQCLQQGAAGILVSRRIETDSPQIVVQDTRLALGKLAAYWREQFDIPLAAITGSNGKTTVKEMLAAILRHVAGDEHVLATEGNLNNDIGLPLTLFKLQAHHRFAVAELGMSNPGEIDYLTHLAHPSVAVVNNAHPAHLQGMGNVEAIAREKGSIFNGLDSSGTAIFNADDAFAPLWKSLAASKKTLTFGLLHDADISADYELKPDSSQLTIQTAAGNVTVALNVPGIHNISNALAATAAALAMGVELSDIAAGLGNFAGVKGRLQRKQGKGGVLVIDDSYNANPSSMRAAIAVLASASGRKILVLGDMGELGNDARRLHEEIGEFAKQSGVDQLFALGDLSQHTVLAFGSNARHFATPVELAEALDPYLQPDTTILVKGSRFMKMERVIDAILKDTNACQQAERVH
jgi:UDP-N-acetylmuramoyl-tripeptide--D-alanyl-D-alanine ligase